MAGEIPFDIKHIPDQSFEIAQRYAQLSRTPDLIDPLQKYLESVAAIPKFEAVALELMPPTLEETGLLVLTALRLWKGRRRDWYDLAGYMSVYRKLRNAATSLDGRLRVTPMFLFRHKDKTIQESYQASLEQFFEPNPLNLGYHPVDPISDALPTVTLAIVNRERIKVPNMHLVREPQLAPFVNQPNIGTRSN